MEPIRARLALTGGQVVYLDMVRGFAAGLVLIHHVQLLLGGPNEILGVAPGPLGVTLFFLVSGFLIDRSARGHRGAYGIKEFLIDRAARIYVCFIPALVFTASVVAALVDRPNFVGEPHSGAWQLVGNLLMLQGYPVFQLARRAGVETSWFVHPYALAEPYWTVPIELYLYISFGLLHFVLVKRSARLTPGLVLLGAIAALPVLYHAATGWGECLSLVWLLGALGSRLFHLGQGGEDSGTQRMPKSTGAIVALMACAGVALAMRLVSRGGSFYDLQNALFLGVLLLGGLQLCGRASWLTASLIRGPAAFFAKTSYALYLTHNVILGWAVMRFGADMSVAHIVSAALVCQLCAWIFWWMFDRQHKRVAGWLKETAIARPAGAGVPQS